MPSDTRAAALAMLARRALSEMELRQRLTQKGYTDIDDTVLRIKDLGYLNDQALAEALAREAERTGRGPLWLANKLRQRGVRAKPPIPDQETLLLRAKAALSKRFAQLAAADKPRAYRFLLSRGFTTDIASQLLR